jgi:hypothetical protein
LADVPAEAEFPSVEYEFREPAALLGDFLGPDWIESPQQASVWGRQTVTITTMIGATKEESRWD